MQRWEEEKRKKIIFQHAPAEHVDMHLHRGPVIYASPRRGWGLGVLSLSNLQADEERLGCIHWSGAVKPSIRWKNKQLSSLICASGLFKRTFCLCGHGLDFSSQPPRWRLISLWPQPSWRDKPEENGKCDAVFLVTFLLIKVQTNTLWACITLDKVGHESTLMISVNHAVCNLTIRCRQISPSCSLTRCSQHIFKI